MVIKQAFYNTTSVKLTDALKRDEQKWKSGKTKMPKTLANILLQQVLKNFNNETDPDGVKWKPKKRPDGRKLLVETGNLRGGFKVTSATFSLIRIENDVEYFQYHQLGTLRIPQRKMLGGDAKLVAKEVDTAIKKIFK